MEQFVGSEFDQRLDAGGDTVPGVRYTTIVPRDDELVTSYTNQFLTGVTGARARLGSACG